MTCTAVITACAAQSQAPTEPAAATSPAPVREPFSSTYDAGDQGRPVLIRNATVLTGTGTRIDNGDVLIANGRIEKGKVADLVLWSGDPLEVTTLADLVWIAGNPVEMRSRQTELRDRYLDRLRAK